MEISDFLSTIIKEAGALAKTYYVHGVTAMTKSHETDIVTEADKAVSEFLIQKISAQFPDHGILSEESVNEPIHPQASVQWVIDPIDGTRNFASGLPSWAVMIAVVVDGITTYAGVYFPMTDELFTATKGQGAWYKEVRLQCSSKQTLQYTLGKMFIAEPAGSYGTHFPIYREAFSRVITDYSIKIREFGNAASLCYVAKGSIDFSFGNCGLDWDYLPTFLICQEAGLIVTDSEGNPWKSGRQDYVIANSALHPQLLSYFKQ